MQKLKWQQDQVMLLDSLKFVMKVWHRLEPDELAKGTIAGWTVIGVLLKPLQAQIKGLFGEIMPSAPMCH